MSIVAIFISSWSELNKHKLKSFYFFPATPVPLNDYAYLLVFNGRFIGWFDPILQLGDLYP